MVLPFLSFSAVIFNLESLFFEFFICSFLRSFLNLTDNFSAINYLNIYSLYIYIYIFFFILRFFQKSLTVFLKKNKVNGFYVKLLYFYYNIQVLSINTFSFYYIFFKKYYTWLTVLFFKPYINYVSYFFNFLGTFFIFWRPLFKKHSYYGLFRSSRTKWINETSINKNTLKYKM